MNFKAFEKLYQWRDTDGFMELFNGFQSAQTVAPGEISDELAPRIRELGLERNCEELWEQGYTVLEDAAPPEYWQELRKTILKAGHPGALGSTLMEKYPNVAEATINPKMLALAEFSVGAGFILSNVASSIRRKGDRNINGTTEFTYDFEDLVAIFYGHLSSIKRRDPRPPPPHQ